MVICHCKAINDVAIRELLADTELTAHDVAVRCGAGTDCGGCVRSIERLLDTVADQGSAAA